MAKSGSKTIVHETYKAEQRLAELALSVEGLSGAVLQGEYARAEATDHDPITAEGYDAYRYRVRALRDIFCPLGWAVARDQNLETIRSPSGRCSVLTRGGDEGVGVRDAYPQPKRTIGEATAKAVRANTTLLMDPNWLNAAPLDRPAFESWMLLVHRSGDNVRAELSLPSKTTDDGATVLGWVERILLPEIDLSEPPGKKSDLPVEPIDVPVTRRR